MLLRNIFVSVMCSTLICAMDINTFWRYTNLSQIEEHTSDLCAIQSQLYLDAIKARKRWALMMLDATGSFPSGSYYGNSLGMGSFDQCINVMKFFDKVAIKGKYCYKGAIVPLPLKSQSENITSKVVQQEDAKKVMALNIAASKANLSNYQPSFTAFSICIPDNCNPTDVFGSYGIRDASCTLKEDQQLLDTGDISFLWFLSVIIILMILSTVYDIHLHNVKEEPSRPLLLSFSVLTNIKKLFYISKTQNQVHCFNGMKAISMIWIIAGHRFLMYHRKPEITSNILDFYIVMGKWYSLVIAMSHIAVDTFLFVSGVLVCYTFLKTTHNTKRFNLVLYYMHRYIRFTPALAVLYFMHVTIIRRIGTGPTWNKTFGDIRNTCLENPWSFFFYVLNYITMDKMCLGHTWYLSMDMQLYMLTPLLLVPLVQHPKKTKYFLLPAVLGASILAPVIIIYAYGIKYRTMDYFHKYYNLTHTRIAPYIIGIAFGVFLWDNPPREQKLRISRRLSATMWTIMLAMTSAIFIRLGAVIENNNAIESILYMGLHRPAWAVFLCWLSFACAYGYAGIINRFLSSDVFQVLSRLCYSTYLIHITVILTDIANQRTLYHFSVYEGLYKVCGDAFFSIVFGLFWSLAFEYPVIAMEKELFRAANKPSRQHLYDRSAGCYTSASTKNFECETFTLGAAGSSN